jgi:hypothetical protein
MHALKLLNGTPLCGLAVLTMSVGLSGPAMAQTAQTGNDAAPVTQTDDTMTDHPVAVLQALDKVTGRISTLRVNVGEGVQFGTLSIIPRACRKRPPEETPESAAFLEIDDFPPAGNERRVFSGWMFASSPGVSAMEHPVFDVWVKDCADPPPPEEPAKVEDGKSN